jgi:hypothetical protein
MARTPKTKNYRLYGLSAEEIQLHYKPYFEAVKKILNGEPVKELDELRVKCNENHLKNKFPRRSEKLMFYYSTELIMTSFIADCENRILMGEKPEEVYKFLNDIDSKKNTDPDESRRICKESLEYYLKYSKI